MLLDILYALISMFLPFHPVFYAPRLEATGIGHPALTPREGQSPGGVPVLPLGHLPAGFLDKPLPRQ